MDSYGLTLEEARQLLVKDYLSRNDKDDYLVEALTACIIKSKKYSEIEDFLKEHDLYEKKLFIDAFMLTALFLKLEEKVRPLKQADCFFRSRRIRKEAQIEWDTYISELEGQQAGWKF